MTPETSYGFDVDDFAREVLERPLDPWERWLAIHLGELLPDGRPRFRIAVAIVARQNGKTFLAKALSLYWLFVEEVETLLGTSTDRTYAKKAWSDIVATARDNEWLSKDIRRVRMQMGEEQLETVSGSTYSFAANNSRAGRSLSVDRWLCDELRQHKGTETWDAVYGAMSAKRNAQVFAITNQGGDTAVKLHELQDTALTFIETGQGDARQGLFEWSALDGSDPTDVEALAMANPNLGYRIDVDDIVAEGRRAKETGGEALSAFLVERMCVRVSQLTPAFNMALWGTCSVGSALPDLAQYRDRVALAFDVSLDRQHATLVAAAEIDGSVVVDVVQAWDGPTATTDMVRDLPGVVAKVNPRVIGWFPSGPAAAVAADLAIPKGARQARRWTPRRVELVEVKEAVTQVAMGAVDLVGSGRIMHSGDPLLTQHVEGCTPSWRGDAYVFQRRGRSSIDAAYAMAAAAHLARTLPPLPPPLTVA